jgi:hypothetical protein
MTLVWGWDATHSDLGGVPAGQGAGYTTGTPDIKWTDADWAAHPGAVRIDQDGRASDTTADIADVEAYAVTPAEAARWLIDARVGYHGSVRPGQRNPGIYCNVSTCPSVNDALVAAGFTSGVPLWLARPGLTMDEAGALIGTTTGVFVIVGVQFADRGAFDSDVFDSAWLDTVSSGAPEPPVTPSAPEGNLDMANMPELAQGATGGPVRTLQGLLVARGYRLGNTGAAGDGIDGDFGNLTHAAVVAFQEFSHIAADGIVGPVTWPLLPIS